MEDKNKFIEEANKNARTIASEIRELSSIEVTSRDTFTKYRDKSQSVLGLFKNLKPLLREDRESLWNSFQEISTEHKRKQEERKRSRITASARKKEAVVATIHEAKNYAAGDITSLRKAEDLLKTANERMRPGWRDGFGVAEDFFHLSDGKMTKEDLEYCWQLWKEVKEKIKFRRNEIFTNNYHIIKEDLYPISDLAVYGDPYEALKRIKATKGKIFSHPMNRDNKESLLRSLDEWWRKAIERIQARKEERERKQKEWELRKAEREKKQKEWEERKAERERKQREWEARKVERERKQREWEARKIERERKQKEWEERQRERERKQREWEERKLERARERERRQREWEDRKRNRSSSRKKSSGCYITTATCLTLGKPDDCLELTTIRRFRDNWLAKQKDGNQIISDYYQIAPSIVAAIDEQRNSEQIYKNIWDIYLNHFFNLIRADKNKDAKTVYLKMVKNLTAEYLNDISS